MKKTLVIFDCFGVICGEVAPYIFSKYISDPNEAKRLKEEYCRPADLGEISSDELFCGMAEILGISKSKVIEEWNSYLTLKQEVIPFIEALSAKADLALLSNAVDGLVEECIDRFDFGKYFDKIFISYKYGMAKPDTRYYKLCVDSFDKDYDEIYMIDDNSANLEPLSELGIKGVLYTGVESLMECQGLAELLK